MRLLTPRLPPRTPKPQTTTIESMRSDYLIRFADFKMEVATEIHRLELELSKLEKRRITQVKEQLVSLERRLQNEQDQRHAVGKRVDLLEVYQQLPQPSQSNDPCVLRPRFLSFVVACVVVVVVSHGASLCGVAAWLGRLATPLRRQQTRTLQSSLKWRRGGLRSSLPRSLQRIAMRPKGALHKRYLA